METGRLNSTRIAQTNSIRIAFLTLIIISLFIGSSSLTQARASFFTSSTIDVSSISSFDKSILEQGDIILRKGNNLVSDMIAMAFPEGDDMSHCGIIVKKQDSLFVIHTISGRISREDGIRINTLEDFVMHSHQNRYKIVRPKSNYNTEKAVNSAEQYLAQKVPFDNIFRMDNGNKFYCSEFVRQVLMDAGSKDVFTYKQIGSNLLIDMASFSDTRYFKTVYSSY